MLILALFYLLYLIAWKIYENKEEETSASLDADYNIDEYKLNEKFTDTDQENTSTEEVIQ